jgi:hypothetical protein
MVSDWFGLVLGGDAAQEMKRVDCWCEGLHSSHFIFQCYLYILTNKNYTAQTVKEHFT